MNLINENKRRREYNEIKILSYKSIGLKWNTLLFSILYVTFFYFIRTENFRTENDKPADQNMITVQTYDTTAMEYLHQPIADFVRSYTPIKRDLLTRHV